LRAEVTDDTYPQLFGISLPQSLSDLVPKVYDDVDPQLWPLAEHSLLSGLIKLMEEGKCQKVGDKYQAA
jgi:hypothetical protein